MSANARKRNARSEIVIVLRFILAPFFSQRLQTVNLNVITLFLRGIAAYSRRR